MDQVVGIDGDAAGKGAAGEATVTELQNADPADAPPFNPVWDPILTAANVLDEQLGGAD